MAAHGRPGVEAAAHALQDRHGQNVSYLLWAVWAGRADPERLRAGAAAARAWESLAVGPLREVRRALKPSHPDLDDALREDLRETVKAAELKGERFLLQALEGLGPRASEPATPLACLRAAAAAWGASVPEGELRALAETLN